MTIIHPVKMSFTSKLPRLNVLKMGTTVSEPGHTINVKTVRFKFSDNDKTIKQNLSFCDTQQISQSRTFPI